jgi:hypothetical protein
MLPEQMRANMWIVGPDTGTSSETIWAVLQGVTPHRPSPPSDPSDFGRCYRLLKLIPEWRARLSEVADKYPTWSGLVAHWDELTALYEDELVNGPMERGTRMAPKTYDRMKALIEEGRIAAGWKKSGNGWTGPNISVVELGNGVSFTNRS